MEKFALAGLLALLVLAPRLTCAATTVLAVDVSAAMGEACSGTDETPLQMVRKAVSDYLRNRADSERGDPVGLVMFGQRSSVLSAPAPDPLRILVLAEELKVQGGKSSLTEGITLARSLLPSEGGHLIVYTRAGPELALLQALAHEIDGALHTEINLVGGPSAAGLTSGSLRLRTLPCGEPAAATATGERVREIIGNALGVPSALVTPESDLVADLGADHSLAFETLSMVCEQLGIALPPDADLTQVGDIVAYAKRAASEADSVPETDLRSGILGGGAPPKPVQVQTLFYATDRQTTGSSKPYDFFGNERMRGPSCTDCLRHRL